MHVDNISIVRRTNTIQCLKCCRTKARERARRKGAKPTGAYRDTED